MSAAGAAGRRWYLPPRPFLLLASLGVCLLIAALDVVAGADVQLLGLLVIGPLTASTRLSTRHTAVVGCWAASAGLAVGLLEGTLLTVAFALMWSGLLLGCALIGYAAQQRSAALRLMTLAREAARSKSALAALVESSSDAILTETLDGRITYWNAAAERLYGYTPQEAIGAHVSMLEPPGREGEVDDLLARIGRREKIKHFETVRMTRGGRLIDVDLTVWPTTAPDGQIDGACAVARDVTEQKRAAAELAALYEQQRHVALTLQRSLMGPHPWCPECPAPTATGPPPREPGSAATGSTWCPWAPAGSAP